MTILAWKDAYAIGVDEIDEQHRELFALGDRLERSLAEGSQDQAVGDALRQMVAYTRTHFRDEEALMARLGYRDLEQHRQAHRQFTLFLTGYLKRLRVGKSVTAEELVRFIQGWLVGHILAEDMKITHAVKKVLRSEQVGG